MTTRRIPVISLALASTLGLLLCSSGLVDAGPQKDVSKALSVEPANQVDPHPEPYFASPTNSGSDEDLPDTDEPQPPRRVHPLRAPGGPSHGGVENDDKPPGDRPATIVLPPATLFGRQPKAGNDPMVAVGENFVAVSDAHTIYFYDKHTGHGIILPKPELQVASSHRCDHAATNGGMCMEQIFAKFFAPFLNDSRGNPDPKRPNPDDINRHLSKPDLGPFPNLYECLVCNPDKPTAAGCVNEGYDVRVIYDKEHKRFWIEANLRNQIWTSGDFKHVVPESTHLHQRFTAIAVSKSEDPRAGFHEFVLSTSPGDWPTIGLHGRFLILGAHGKNKVHLFDADKLRAGNDVAGLFHLGSYGDSDFDSDHIWPVIQHDIRGSEPFIPTFPKTESGSDNVPTFLVGTGGGGKITIYAFDAPKNLIDQPKLEFQRPSLMSATVEIKHDIPSIIANPVYRNGFIYLTWEECVDGGNWGDICNRRIRVVRIPVFRVTGLDRIVAAKDRDLGYQDYVFGGDPVHLLELTSYDIPALDVNRNDDVALVYGRAAPLSLARPGAYYAVSYHDTRGLVMDGVLREAQCSDPEKLDCIHAGPGDTHLDLSCVAIDPADETTAWMAHEFVDGKIGDFEMVVGHVKP